MKAGKLRKTEEQWKQEFETAWKLAEKLRQAVVNAGLGGLDTAFDQYESNRAQYDRLKSQKEHEKGEQSLNNSERPPGKHADDDPVASGGDDEESDGSPSGSCHNPSSHSQTADRTSFAITDPEIQN